VVGFDAYPNYYQPEPVRGDVVGERVSTLLDLGGGKRVVAMETGYPTGPAELGFNADLQAQYIDESFHSAYDAGISGYFLFGTKTSETQSVVITQEDIDTMAVIAPLFYDGAVAQLALWVLAHLDYALDPHFIDVLQSVEGYWGLVLPDGSHKPGFAVMQSIADEVYP
jgi:hypothetical protein